MSMKIGAVFHLGVHQIYQNFFIGNFLKLLLWFFIFTAFQACSAPDTAKNPAAELTFRSNQACVFPVFENKCIPINLPSAAPQVSAGSGEWFVVGGRRFQGADGAELFVLYASSPSRPQSDGLGYCGSGIESKASLWAIDYQRKRAIYRDEIALESCLENFALNVPSERAFIIDLKVADPSNWQIEWLDHPRFGAGKHLIKVQGDGFIITKAAIK